MGITKDTTIALAQRTFRSPALDAEYGPGTEFKITAKAHLFGNNSNPHFSVTADVSTTGSRRRCDIVAGGCMHDQSAALWPEVAPIIALHIANSDDGQPMHAEGNGWYWIAGAKGGMGERYHGGNGTPLRSPDECVRIFADHVRLPLPDAQAMVDRIATREDWRAECAAMSERWAREAEEGLSLIRQLAT